MNGTERKYFDDAMSDFADVSDFDKPLMIVSAGKSPLAYETIVMMADRCNFHCVLTNLVCEDGETHEHAFVAVRNPPGMSPDAWGNRAIAGLRIVTQMLDGDFSRANGQYLLGLALGHPIDEVLDFIASDMARACSCDCCGGIYGLDR